MIYIRRVLKNKHIATSKNTMRNLRTVEKVCYFKNGFKNLSRQK